MSVQGNIWVAGARPKTLPAAVVPVAVGTAAVVADGDSVLWWRAAACLVVSLALQIGTNYANDYSDGVRGTDDASRVGPMRLVGSGSATPAAVRTAAMLSFGVAAIVGLAVAVNVGLELLVVGAVSLLAGWFYTGGPRPYGYAGLGEAFVFVFFGLVATIGSAYVHTRVVSTVAVLAAVPVGLLITSILVVNNLRDIPGDTESGKRTLAVRMGDPSTRRFYHLLLAGSFVAAPIIAVVASTFGPLLVVVSVPIAVGAWRIIESGVKGPGLIPALGQSGKLVTAYGAALTLGLVI